MSKLFATLKWIWGFLGAAVIAEPVSTLLRQGTIATPTLFSLAGRHAGIASAALILLGGLTGWAWLVTQRSKRRDAFTLAKRAAELEPADLGFQRFRLGQEADVYGGRPFYDGVFIPRRVQCPHGASGLPFSGSDIRLAPAESGPESVWSQDSLRKNVERGGFFVLVGRPLDGKTRFIYEILRGLPDFWVVVPRKSQEAPPRDAFKLFRKRRVVLLLDDLHQFTALDFIAFHKALREQATVCAVLAACRSGPELEMARATPGIRPVLESFTQQLALQPESVEDRAKLARALGKSFSAAELERAPNLGYVVTEEAIQVMRNRAAALPQDEKDVMDAMRVLSECEVRPFTVGRIEAVMKQIQRRSDPAEGWVTWLRHRLARLEKEGFLTQPSTRPEIHAVSDYLEFAIEMRHAPDVATALDQLTPAFKASRDAEGLVLLAHASIRLLNSATRAIPLYEQSAEIEPERDTPWYFKAVCLNYLGRTDDALASIDQALRIAPDNSGVWMMKSQFLSSARKYADALSAAEEGLRLLPNAAHLLLRRADCFCDLARREEALKDLARVSQLTAPDDHSWLEIGKLFANLGELDEALSCYDKVIATDSSNGEAWTRKGNSLCRLDRVGEGIAALEMGARLNPQNGPTWMALGCGLAMGGREKEAAEPFRRGLAAGGLPDDAPLLALAWYSVGADYYSGGEARWPDALHAFEKAIEAEPLHVKAGVLRANILVSTNKAQDAIESLRALLVAHPENARGWLVLGRAYGELKRTDEMFAAMRRFVELSKAKDGLSVERHLEKNAG